MKILNTLINNRIPISTLDERSSFTSQDGFRSSDGRIDERDDFETGTEFVFDSEGVAVWDGGIDVGRGTGMRWGEKRRGQGKEGRGWWKWMCKWG